MNDWLVFLFKISGFGAVLVVALWIMGKWLWTKINAALDSYVKKYAEESATIDARIERIEKLAEEQARLTRTVESIKDEIAAQATLRDSRWVFKKDVYEHLVISLSDLISGVSQLQSVAVDVPPTALQNPNADLRNRLQEGRGTVMSSAIEFARYANLAPLATAHSVLPLLKDALVTTLPTLLAGANGVDGLQNIIEKFNQVRTAIQDIGHEDLWGTPESEAKADGGTIN